MATDLFEKLAELPVPPPPAPLVFDRSVHKRINDRLFVGQLFDFCLRAAGFAALHFARAVIAVFRFSFTGKFDEKNDRNSTNM